MQVKQAITRAVTIIPCHYTSVAAPALDHVRLRGGQILDSLRLDGWSEIDPPNGSPVDEHQSSVRWELDARLNRLDISQLRREIINGIVA